MTPTKTNNILIIRYALKIENKFNWYEINVPGDRYILN